VASTDADPFAPDADPNAPDSTPLPDADPTAPDAGPLCEDWARTPSEFDPCTDITEITDNIVVSKTGTYVYDTDMGTLTEPDGTTLVAHTSANIGGATALVTGQFTMGNTAILRAEGTRPFMIISWSTISIDGEIDVSSQGNQDPGAGANSALCNAATNGTDDTDGGGGGGGGGFGSAGGDGGPGRNGDNAAGIGGLVGATAFHGGCPGERGGIGDGELSDVGEGGDGGGALFLAARTTLTIQDQGVVHAGGGSGGGANGGAGDADRAGGGGGGSGGFIGLEAETVSFVAGSVIAANGAGGGGGGNNNPSDPGTDGQPGDQVAAGGDGEGGAPAGDGGNGGFIGLVDGQVGIVSDRGGGGGGGGVGYIAIYANMTTGSPTVVSPAPTTISAP
jgi:hypothetical protein